MKTMMKFWVRRLIILGTFGVFINLIYLALPIYIMVIYDKVLLSFSESTLATMIVGVLISLIMMGILEYCRLRILEDAGNSLVKKLTPAVLKGMHDDATAIKTKGYTRGLYDLELLRNAIVHGHVFYVLELPWVLIYLGILFYIHPLIGGVVTVVVFIAALFQILLGVLEKRRYTITEVAFQASADFARTSLLHAELVSGLGMMDSIRERYHGGYQKMQSLRSESDAFHSRIGTVVRFLSMIASAAVIGAGAFAFFTETITAGAIVAALILVARIFYPFERNLSDLKATIAAIGAFKRLDHYLSLLDEKTKINLPAPEGKFTVEALSLGIDGRRIFQNISFELQPGETLGILGPSFAGKTSLCKVLLGIWPATGGKVRLDGAEMAQWPEEELGRYVGYLPEETEVFPGSVAENIARFRQVDSEKVVRAAQSAGVHEMILKLPQGYDTMIDQTEKNLSAGQRQLISVARALYDYPKLVVMDEPHTHLDETCFRLMLYALENLKKDKITTIVVTDRPNLIVTMDKLLVLRDGQVITYGPGKEVLAQLAKKQQPQQAVGV
jgi:ATP-binding cassette, subfamily C, bacterial EexD